MAFFMLGNKKANQSLLIGQLLGFRGIKSGKKKPQPEG